MSNIDKNTCPVCFTKMRKVRKVLTCPECGYKYCDHNRDREDMFDTAHTHESNYTTYTNTEASSQSTSTDYVQSNNHTSQQTIHVQPDYSSDSPKKKSSASKLIKIIIIFYLIMFFCPFVCFGLSAIFNVALGNHINEQFNSSEEIAPSSLLPKHIDGDAPILLDSEDGEFIPELLCSVFDTTDWESITNEEIYSIDFLEIHRDYDNYLCASYYNKDGSTGQFASKLTELDSSDLNVFIGLELLYTEEVHYSPEDLCDLQLLHTLACSNSPAEVIKIVHDPAQLTELSLSFYDTSADLTGIEKFINVNILQINAPDTGITNASVLTSMEHLESLSLSDNGTIQDFDFLNELTQLYFLKLAAPGLSDLSFVENMPELSSLYIGVATNITDISPLLARADTLRNLDLSYNPNIKDFAPLAKLPNLEDVTISFCDISDISYLSELENLSYLIIGGNQIKSLEPIAKLPNLQFVSTSGNPIEDFAGLDDIVMHYSF